MARGDPDQDRGLVDRNGARSMPEDDPLRSEARAGRSLETGEDASGEREMRLVVEGDDAAARRWVRPDPTDEDDDPAESRSR
jgi:hypothetical protein